MVKSLTQRFEEENKITQRLEEENKKITQRLEEESKKTSKLQIEINGLKDEIKVLKEKLDLSILINNLGTQRDTYKAYKYKR